MKNSAILALALLLTGCGGPKAEAPRAGAPVTDSAPAVVEPSFAREVQPVFTQSCLPCHSGGANAKAGYDLTNYQGVMGNGKDAVPNVVAGKPDSSLLYTTLKDGKMPPTGPLEAARLDIILKWITAGSRNN